MDKGLEEKVFRRGNKNKEMSINLNRDTLQDPEPQKNVVYRI